MTLIAKIKVRNNCIDNFKSKNSNFKITNEIVYFLNHFDRRYKNHVFGNFIIDIQYKDQYNFNVFFYDINPILNGEIKIYEDLNEVESNKSTLINNKVSFDNLIKNQNDTNDINQSNSKKKHYLIT